MLSVVALEAGWVVTEVGRQPWIVRNYMKVEDAATGNDGRVGHVPRRRCALYVGVGVTLILILRQMSRRFRDGGEAELDDGRSVRPARADRSREPAERRSRGRDERRRSR